LHLEGQFYLDEKFAVTAGLTYKNIKIGDDVTNAITVNSSKFELGVAFKF